MIKAVLIRRYLGFVRLQISSDQFDRKTSLTSPEKHYTNTFYKLYDSVFLLKLFHLSNCNNTSDSGFYTLMNKNLPGRRHH